ncbi:mitochondrial substrate carrier [Conidiobolus coronatus NRRL 28638]|uniref:Mitochondrial substrate carrier n=1 Tax=Conidiobolus coronatus (strain ATCC 28846 / CBS 209.66 / NRRL 28638) TaxID=796925 RepID=A0A137NZQ2_CONC2|nr:mitochondrial substrate carrier [Conidiobolus coronatus NRRL 28638]|eukprot:KXN68212.1 mitochondrial substrate carrier [Conidiobolus coronatus NRRL 28638]
MNIGGATGIVSWFFSYPMDVIKSRVQSNNSPSTKLIPNIKQIWNETTPRGKNFFKGVSVTLVRAFPVNAISFTIYELVKKEISQD